MSATTFTGAIRTGDGVLGLEAASSAEEESTGRATELATENLTGTDVVFWGDQTNLFPQEVLSDLESSDILEVVIRWKAQQLVGGGAVYGPIVPGPGGQPMIEPVSIPEIDDFLDSFSFPLYAMEAALDYYRYYNAAAEIIRVGDKVTGVWSQDMSTIRLAQNNSRGMITKAYQSNEWEKGPRLSERKKVTKWRSLDPWYNLDGQIREVSDDRTLVPLRFQTGGRKYYAMAPWDGFRQSKWFSIQQKVAEAKEAMLKHMMVLRYQLEIDDRYWPRAYPDWLKLNEADREKLRRKTKDDFESWAAGTKNNGKTLLTGKVPMPNSHESYSLWTINQLKFEIPTGAYIEDSAECDHHAIRAFNVTPSLIGLSASKNHSSDGSGSVNRVDRTNYLLGEQMHGDLLMIPIKAAFKVNKYGDRNKKLLKGRRLGVRFGNMYATTSDRTNQASAKPNAEKQTDDGDKNPVQDNG